MFCSGFLKMGLLVGTLEGVTLTVLRSDSPALLLGKYTKNATKSVERTHEMAS
jgi:hypothetical protein